MERSLGSGLSTVVIPDVITGSCLSGCVTADNTALLNKAHEQYQSSTGGSTVEKLAETQISIRLALAKKPRIDEYQKSFSTFFVPL